MAVDQKTQKKIIAAMRKGIKRNAERIFDLAQDSVNGTIPVDTGNLKRSAIWVETAYGYKIVFRADYASEQEFGRKESPITGSQVVHKKSYFRKGFVRKDGVAMPPMTIKAHDVTYENKRLIAIRAKYITKSGKTKSKKIFRVINKNAEIKPHLYLTGAIQKGLPYLLEDMAFYLEKI